jgi:hypothetical protein
VALAEARRPNRPEGKARGEDPAEPRRHDPVAGSDVRAVRDVEETEPPPRLPRENPHHARPFHESAHPDVRVPERPDRRGAVEDLLDAADESEVCDHRHPLAHAVPAPLVDLPRLRRPRPAPGLDARGKKAEGRLPEKTEETPEPPVLVPVFLEVEILDRELGREKAEFLVPFPEGAE